MKGFQTQDGIIQEESKTILEKYPEYNFEPATNDKRRFGAGVFQTLLHFTVYSGVGGLAGLIASFIQLPDVWAIFACLGCLIAIIASVFAIRWFVKKIKTFPMMKDVADYVQARYRKNDLVFEDHLFFVKNRKFGLLLDWRKILLPAEYDKLEWFDYKKHVLKATKDGKSFLTDIQGNKLS